MRAKYFLLLFAVSILFSACKKESEPYADVNNWIRDNMEYFYFWNDNVPADAPGDELPETFFERMLEPEDIFSQIDDNAEEFLAELNGSSFSAGFSPAFGRFTGSNNIFIIVEFVYPNTPASRAGLLRGDIILEINGEQLTTTNYLDLFYYDEGPSTYILGSFNATTNSIGVSGEITVTKEQLDLDPIVYSNVYEIDGKKIGYMFYSRFLAGDTNQFITSVTNTLSDFNAAGVDELIIDLRYNPGGRVSAAVNMASIIVPEMNAAAEDVLIQYQYNEDLLAEIAQTEGPDSESLFNRFNPNPPVNLSLDRVYFIATNSSASASELIINGLRPYMEVYHIGENTFGKFYGSFVLSGENATPPNNYAMTPVSFKYANADGVTDFRNGLEPDIEAEEDIFQPFAIGDLNDPMLSAAINHITSGVVTPVKVKSRSFERLPDLVELRRGSLFLERKF